MRTSARGLRIAGWITVVILLGGLLLAQESKTSEAKAGQDHAANASAPQTEPGKRPGQGAAGQPHEGINQEFGIPLAEESRAAAKEAETGTSQEKMIEELKQSPSVHLVSRILHVSPFAAYWISIVLDFAILALLIIFGLKKSLPAVFRARTATIRQGIDEGRRASEDAGRRLSEIEAKLARLSEEVNGMRAAAEQEAANEAQRIHAAAEQDKQHIMEAADAEIAAVTRTARRELKAFAADLAVALAERRIRVDQATDEALVRSFTDKLSAGRDGR